MDNVKYTVVKIPSELHLQLKILAIKEGKELGQLTTGVLSKYVQSKQAILADPLSIQQKF